MFPSLSMDAAITESFSQKHILFEFVDLYNHFSTITCIATDIAGRSSNQMAGQAAWDVTLDIMCEICDSINDVWYMAGSVENITSEFVKTLVKKDETIEQTTKAICVISIKNRKQIRENSKVDEIMLSRLLPKDKPFDEVKYIKMLLTFENELKMFKKMIMIQKCNYLFNVERLIHLTGKLDLIEEHKSLAEKLEAQETYNSLFFTLPSNELISQLPNVLGNIVIEYCKFCWSYDDNDFFDRLVTI